MGGIEKRVVAGDKIRGLLEALEQSVFIDYMAALCLCDGDI